MRIRVDPGVCDGHAECTLAAPALFALHAGDTVVTVLVAEPGEELRASALAAADGCPARAITVED